MLSNQSKKILLRYSPLIVLVFSFAFFIFSCSPKTKITTTSVDTTVVKQVLPEVDTEYYAKVEQLAKYPNGDFNAFKLYLKKNIKYPAQALKKLQQGTTAMQFGVDCYGSIKFTYVLKSSGSKLLDNEVIRALKASPKWTPAKIGNKSVGQLFVIQVTFKAKTRSIDIH